ncbi:hypothetical protein EXIGLDRAFT_138432 [Exidia glandulosa HHB12029]|uniref:Uncharacterized protein n=1 Tax=Exidia glandulosa HHB12029 TaxID=1314781 RepID=A0A165FZQ6_EXIGL|nr:hypothetical protein EXIGLDRAFT_138432 [Exidia glandulosa HHB12029]
MWRAVNDSNGRRTRDVVRTNAGHVYAHSLSSHPTAATPRRIVCSTHHPPSARVTVRESCIERARTNEDGAYGKAGVVEPRKRNECTDAEGSVIVRVLAYKLGTRLRITTHATLSRHCSSVDRFAPNTPNACAKFEART